MGGVCADCEHTLVGSVACQMVACRKDAHTAGLCLTAAPVWRGPAFGSSAQTRLTVTGSVGLLGASLRATCLVFFM